MMERGKQISLLRDYVFSSHNLELPDNLLVYLFEQWIHRGVFVILYDYSTVKWRKSILNVNNFSRF